ncbi:hypothetical protein CEXT_466301 [Caerostris extrusa]|uniref:Uncharacterized protein n=1 Tax=Caerostris extrusa TaxID=172846 RepID=A0AAV4RPG3_CAEEX|nr:hypothetical protein CEXT_466301 [Caerostris extrusa]
MSAINCFPLSRAATLGHFQPPPAQSVFAALVGLPDHVTGRRPLTASTWTSLLPLSSSPPAYFWFPLIFLIWRKSFNFKCPTLAEFCENGRFGDIYTLYRQILLSTYISSKLEGIR